MREYEFRGKRVDTKEWVYGSYHYFRKTSWILEPNTPDYIGWEFKDTYFAHEVDPATVGQYIGRYDNYENMIFTGDVVEVELVEYGKHHSYENFIVKYNEKESKYVFMDINGEQWTITISNMIRVIGNVTDNPELLEAEK